MKRNPYVRKDGSITLNSKGGFTEGLTCGKGAKINKSICLGKSTGGFIATSDGGLTTKKGWKPNVRI